MTFPILVIFLKVLVLCVGLAASALGAAVTESPFVSAVPLELEEEGEEYQADYDYEYSDPTTVDSFTTQEDTTTTTTSQPLQKGQIAWAPYSMMRADKVSPVNLPSYHTGMTLPPITGRWLSRNKDTVQLINTKPAFIYPQVPLVDQEKKEEVKEVRSSRVRRGSGSYTNNNHVALCGGVFRDLYGIIQSPEYPLYYPNNKVGGWMTKILDLSFMFLLLAMLL